MTPGLHDPHGTGYSIRYNGLNSVQRREPERILKQSLSSDRSLQLENVLESVVMVDQHATVNCT